MKPRQESIKHIPSFPSVGAECLIGTLKRNVVEDNCVVRHVRAVCFGVNTVFNLLLYEPATAGKQKLGSMVPRVASVCASLRH